MFNRSFVSILIVTSSFILAIGQTPEVKKDKVESQAFAFSFDGNGGYLGVQTREVSKENFAKFGLRGVRGVAVDKVLENSPAATAGIKDGDVIVRFNGDEITSSRKLTRLVGEVDPDHQVKLTIVRNGSEQEITATLGTRPTPKFGEGNFSFTMPPMDKFDVPEVKNFENFKNLPQMKDLPQWKEFPKGEMPQVFMTPKGDGEHFSWHAGEGRQIGVGVSTLTKQLVQHFGVAEGVMINEVRENSPAAKAGLKAGDIIVEADGKAVKGDFDVIRSVNGKKEGDVSITIVRDGKRQTISVTPEAAKDGGFFFRMHDEGGWTSPPAMPAMPAMKMTPPTPMAPMTAPMPLLRPGRVI